jgi:biotin carboxyl carrier protein
MKYFVHIGGREVELEVDGDQVTVAGRTYTAVLSSVPGTPIRQLRIDGRPLPLAVGAQGRGQWTLTHLGEHWNAEVVDERTRHIRSLTGGGAQHHAAGVLRAPMPGLVVRVQASPGQRVPAGASLVVLEAMKMENELRAPAAAAVRAVLFQPGQAVEKGQVLVEFEL